jgi:serine/threonine protein kinase
MNQDESLLALQEIDLLGSIDSPFIVKYYDSFISENDNINIVMEYCGHGDLFHYLNRLNRRYISENIVWKFFI